MWSTIEDTIIHMIRVAKKKREKVEKIFKEIMFKKILNFIFKMIMYIFRKINKVQVG